MAKSFDELVKRSTSKKTRAKAALRTQELLSQLLLSELRRLAGKSQQQLARALGIKQPSLSKLEKQSDMQISTLQKIVQALGGELEVLAKFPKGTTVKINQFDRPRRRNSRRRPQPVAEFQRENRPTRQ
jgi:transcriptional regulator with XRE-family HTH domain